MASNGGIRSQYRYVVERRPVWGERCWGIWDRVSVMWFDKGLTRKEARDRVRELNANGA